MSNNLSKLKVYYGWCRLNKIRKRPALSVIFSNSVECAYSERAKNLLNKMQVTLYERYQTEAEAKDAVHSNRIFTEYNMFLDDKKINGHLDYLLEQNRRADRNNVKPAELDKIQESLMKGFKQAYRDITFNKPLNRQLEMDLDMETEIEAEEII